MVDPTSKTWLIDLCVERLSAANNEFKELFEPKHPDGTPHQEKRRFLWNLTAALYAGNPDQYIKSGPTASIGSTTVNTGQADFWKTLLKSTQFLELRDKTMRNLPITGEVLLAHAELAWAMFIRNEQEKSTSYMRKKGDLTDQDLLKAAVRRFAEEAGATAEAAEEIAEIMGAPGYGTYPSQNEFAIPSSEVHECLEATKKLAYFKDLMKLIGRCMETKKLSVSNRMRRGTKVPHKFELGSDLPSVLPSELAIGRKLRRLFLAQLADGGLLQDGLGKPEPQESGSVIFLVDETGSMQFENRIDWAKAMAAAAHLQCKEDGRFFAYYPVGVGFAIKDERITLPDILSKFMNYGSTDIPGVIEDLLDCLKTPPKSWDMESIDIIFVTDENSPGITDHRRPMIEEFKAKKKELGVRLLSIVIGGDETGFLDEISDRCLRTSTSPAEDWSNTTEVFEWLN